jgi:glycosyltransferase involved in cell wall biosynthesis
MVTTSYPRWDGDHAGHFVASLAEAVADAGLEVSVIAPHAADVAETERVRGVDVRRVRYLPESWERVAYGSGILPNLRRDPRAALGLPALRRALARALQEYGAEADVVHVHWAPTALLAKASVAEAPVVLTLHGSDATLAMKGGVFRRMLADALSRAAGAIVVSGEQQSFLRDTGLFSGPVAVIPSGVPLELTERPRPVRGAGQAFTFVYVGRLIESKGVLDLIDAFSAVDSRMPGAARLVLVGSGPLEGRIRERIVARRLMGEVIISGHLSHDGALEAIADADALVLPSYGEGSPLAVTEALAMGTPVIGTTVGAIPELVGEQGLTVEPGDVGALEAAMSSWVNDPAGPASLGQEARRRMAEEYAWPALARQTVGLYEEAVAAAGRLDVAPEVDL